MASVPDREVIAVHGSISDWIEPWYGAYAILGALASGLAGISIPLIVIGGGGNPLQAGAAIAVQNIGALFAPLWGTVADRRRAYRTVFFTGFILIGTSFLGFTVLDGLPAWLVCAFLLGFGTGASNTIASLFVVEFTPKDEWAQRISWLQTFNAAGSVLGIAIAGRLTPHIGTLIAAMSVIPAIILGGHGLPVRKEHFTTPRLHLSGSELTHLLRRAGPNCAPVVANLRRPHRSELAVLGQELTSAFGLFLISWFLFSLAITSFGALFPMLMLRSFGLTVAQSSTLMSVAIAASIPLYNVSGRLAARFGPERMLSVGIGTRMICLAGLALLAYFHPTRTALPVILQFAVYQSIWPLLSVVSNELAASLAPSGEGAAMGLFNAVGSCAAALGAVLGGKVADKFGYPAVSLFATFGALLALAFGGMLIRTRARATKRSSLKPEGAV